MKRLILGVLILVCVVILLQGCTRKAKIKEADFEQKVFFCWLCAEYHTKYEVINRAINNDINLEIFGEDDE